MKNNTSGSPAYIALLASLASLAVPVALCFIEIFNEPVRRVDGSIDDGAERAAGLFLVLFLVPAFLISYLYHYAIVVRACSANKPNRFIFGIGFTVSLVISGLLAYIGAGGNIFEKLTVFAFLLTASAVCVCLSGVVIRFKLNGV